MVPLDRSHSHEFQKIGEYQKAKTQRHEPERENGHRRWTMVAAFLWPSYGYRQRPMVAALNCCSQAASYFGKKDKKGSIHCCNRKSCTICCTFYTLKWSWYTYFPQNIDWLEGWWHGRNLKIPQIAFHSDEWWVVVQAQLCCRHRLLPRHLIIIIAYHCFVLSFHSHESWVSFHLCWLCGLDIFKQTSVARTRTRWKKQALTIQKQLLFFGGPSLGQGNMPGPDTWAFSFMCLCLAALLFQSASFLAHSLSLAFVHELYSSRLYGFSLTERWKDQRDPVNPLMEWISESLTVFFMMGFARTAWFSGERLAQHLRFTISGVTAEHYILAYRSKATWRFCWSLQFIRRPILAHGCLGGHHCELHQRERESIQGFSLDVSKLQHRYV